MQRTIVHAEVLTWGELVAALRKSGFKIDHFRVTKLVPGQGDILDLTTGEVIPLKESEEYFTVYGDKVERHGNNSRNVTDTVIGRYHALVAVEM